MDRLMMGNINRCNELLFTARPRPPDRALTGLRKLDLGGNDIGPDGAASLRSCLNQLTGLRSLYLHGDNDSDNAYESELYSGDIDYDDFGSDNEFDTVSDEIW